MRPQSIRVSACVLCAILITLSLLAVRSGAQQIPPPRTGLRRAPVSGQAMSPIASAHKTFEQAARIMESALPIYDGHRHRAIELAKLAAREIKEAATGASGPANGNNTQHKTAAQRAALVPKGANVELSKYTPAQISASNAKMQQGLTMLQQGLQQVNTIGNDPGNHMSDAAEFGNYAIQAANKGLQFVAGK